MGPLSLPFRVTAAFIQAFPFSITAAAGGGAVAALGRVLFRPGLGGACALLFLLLFLLLLLLFPPEGFGLELVPLAADVFESAVKYVSGGCVVWGC